MTAEFDRHAAAYDGGFDNPLKRLAGGSPDAYVAVKARWLLRREPALESGEPRVLDYGCGVGDLLRVLTMMGVRGQFTGCDVSEAMLAEAELRWPEQFNARPSFVAQQGARTNFADAQFDVAIASAVLHHVPLAERPEVFAELGRVLRPGGRLVVFEHNPRNPLVRHVVARTPIDRDAQLLDPREVRQGLEEQGFCDLETAYLMFAPPRLSVLQGLDRVLFWLPLGAQYAVTARKPV
jgi:SAM-dependent methyltransferase